MDKFQRLKDYRNQLLAHNLRVNGNSVFDKDFARKDYRIPFTNSESILLANMVKIIMNCIATEFPDLIQKLDWTENILSKTNFESSQAVSLLPALVLMQDTADQSS